MRKIKKSFASAQGKREKTPLKKSLGQHFLSDPVHLSSLYAAIKEHIPSTDTLLEIGPGGGVLTELLYKGYPCLYAVEKDRRFTAPLKSRFPGLHLMEADATMLPVRKGITRFSAVGNLPYNVSIPIIHELIATGAENIIVMIQKEVAERLCASAGNKEYAYESVFIDTLCERNILFSIPPEAFSPPPKVESSVVFLKRRPQALICQEKERNFFRFLRLCFKQKRKMLRNNLTAYAPETLSGVFKETGTADTVRAEALATERLVSLFTALEGREKG